MNYFSSQPEPSSALTGAEAKAAGWEGAEIIPFPQAHGNRLERDKFEAQLLVRLAHGDKDAAREMWTAFSQGLLTLIYRILGDREESEDVLQEAMLRIWEKSGQFDPTRGRAFVWAAMLTRGLALDCLRRRQRRQRISDKVQLEAAAESQKVAVPQEESQSLEWMQLALGKLTVSDRKVITDIVLYGKTSVEVAEAAGESDVTVRSRLRRALQRLRDVMKLEKFND
jgi:RNA polymerase sigma-70 factor, ECF subfamily